MTALQTRRSAPNEHQMFRNEEPSGGDAPVAAETTLELLELLRSRLRTPSNKDLKRAAAWLVPASVITGVLVSLGDGPIGAGLAGLVILVVLAWRLPHFAAYVMIAGAPVVVGFGRDQVLPMLRVNEALLAVLLLVLSAKWLVSSRRGGLRAHSPAHLLFPLGFKIGRGAGWGRE